MPKVLIVTNDFPPRRGGIQSFVHALASRMPAGAVIVYAPAWPGAGEFDARQPFPVIRHPGSLMLPVPSVARRAIQIMNEHGCDTVLFGAAAPLGLLAPALRRAGARRIVAITHGHEAGWAALPGARWLLRRIGDQADVVTYLGEYFRMRLKRALTPEAAAAMVRLAPGVDTDAFRPSAGGDAIRVRLGLGRRPIVLCVSRLVPRKGQDTLIRAWPRVLAAMGGPAKAQLGAIGPAGSGRGGADGTARTRAADAAPAGSGLGGAGGTARTRPAGAGPEAAGPGGAGRAAGPAGGPGAGPVLLLVGDGPYRARLARLAERTGVADSVIFTGPVPREELPAYYDAGDVFAMPCRTRRFGLDVEGLGIVYLEASAAGLPVVGGDSGGAPDAILDGETGFVVSGRNPDLVAGRVISLLSDPDQAAALGKRGTAWVERDWRWELVAERLGQILAGPGSAGPR
jgi:phosphatidylinositol alpha-1,6-mannosyltransferase